MSDKYSTIQQHQPLRVPASFDKQGKALIVQLDEIFDDLYKRFGRLRIEDMGSAFRKRLEDDEGNITEFAVDLGHIFAVVKNEDGDISDIEIVPGGINMKGSKQILLESGDSTSQNYSFVLINPSTIEMNTTGLVKLLGSGLSSIRFYDSKNGQVFSVDVEHGMSGQRAFLDSLKATSAEIGTLTVGKLVCNNVNMPNVIYSVTRPADGNNTLWLEPKTESAEGDGEAFSESVSTGAAAAHSCTQTQNGFVYSVGLSANVDLTDVDEISFSGSMYRNGADQHRLFTVTAEINCSDGTSFSLGQVGNGALFGNYNLSATKDSNIPAKIATGITYTLAVSGDGLAHYSYFNAGTLSYSGTHSTDIPTDECIVHYIP